MKSLMIIFIGVYVLGLGPIGVAGSEEWKDEFDSICSRTDIATSLTVEELKTLIERCDRLKVTIEGLPDETQRKIYLKRLQMCRELFVYVLKTKTEN